MGMSVVLRMQVKWTAILKNAKLKVWSRSTHNLSKRSKSMQSRSLFSPCSWVCKMKVTGALLRCHCSNIVKIKCNLSTYLLTFSFRLYFNYYTILNGRVKFCQGKYLFWHPCPADEFQKKLIWIPESVNLKWFTIVKEQYLSAIIMKVVRKGSLHKDVTVQ